ncbi:MAG TPA: hypothetical protein VHO46_14670 [Bacteroidales bacterium]|nr:hypothetical protein [Bacteroidales bacterium]
MFWNVENAFDIYDDPESNDNDFLPDGLMRWNSTRYWKKINDIYKTIIAAGEWMPPEIIGFCEIENRKVLEDIINKTNLSRYDYEIIHEDSPDERGIDVCMIYRKDKLRLIGYRYFLPIGFNHQELHTRAVLYACLEAGRDTIHIILNHWPSKRGGMLASQDLRMSIAGIVNSQTDSLLNSERKMAKILIAGDFNCGPDDEEMKMLMSSAKQSRLVNLTSAISGYNEGTYRFQGTWEMIDQVVASRFFLSCGEGYYVNNESVRIFNPAFLLTKDPNYPGNMPFSMYRGRRYQGGISDHLPVLVDLYFHPWN